MSNPEYFICGITDSTKYLVTLTKEFGLRTCTLILVNMITVPAHQALQYDTFSTAKYCLKR